MPTNRITMRQIRQALRLHLEAGLSYAQVALAMGIGKATVGKFVLLARAAGVDWALAQSLSDEELEARLYREAVPRSSHQLEPDYAWIHQELKRAGVTLQLLWEEYQRGLADAGLPAYKYTSFCVKYRNWAASLKRSMRQTHIAGERLFVDYAGQTVPVIDAASGEIRRAQIFVAVLGASNYTYLCVRHRHADRGRLGGRNHRCAGVHRRRAAADRSRPDPCPDRPPRPLRAHAGASGRGVLGPLRRGSTPGAPGSSARQGFVLILHLLRYVTLK
jgi:hypothetical protein